jgi:hypothetical protein
MEGVAHYSGRVMVQLNKHGKRIRGLLILRLFDQRNNIRFGKLTVNSSNLYRGIVNNHPKSHDSVFNNVARLQGSPGVVDFYGGGGNSMLQVMMFAQVGRCVCRDGVTRR